MSWRSRKTHESTRLELELEADAAGDTTRTYSRVPARGTHPGAPANQSRNSRAARSRDAGRPSTAPNVGVRRAPTPSLEPLSDEPSAPAEDRNVERPMGWRKASVAEQRRLRQELLEAVEQGRAVDVEVLLRFGTPLRGTHDEHLDSSLLHTAALFGYTRICELLIEHGAEVNAVDVAMETPLMWAAKWGHPEICRLLLDNGALLHLKCSVGETARQKAEHGGQSAVCQAMQSYEEDGRAFVQAIFSEIDTDGSGTIDQEELAEYVLQQRADHSLVLGKIENEVETLRSKLDEESEAHLRAQEQLAEVSAAYETAAESAGWWEQRYSGSAAELAELREALRKAEQRAERLAEKNAKHDSIVSEVQASAQVAIKAASHAVASALDRRGSNAGLASTSAAASASVDNGQQHQRPRTAEGAVADPASIKPSLSQGRRWSVSAGGPSGAGSGMKRPSSAQGEEWQAIAGFIQHGQRALPLPAGLLQTIMEQLDEVLRWIVQGGAGELEGVSRSQRPLSPTSPSKRKKKKKVYAIDKAGTWKPKPTESNRSKSPRTRRTASPSSGSVSPTADDPVLPWITERLSQAHAAGMSLRCLLEEGDIPLPVRVQERQSRQLERLERKQEKLNAELLQSKATSERWTARALAAEARATRAENTAAELQKRIETAEAELQLVKQQKRAAVGAEVQRQRKLEEQLSMQAERVRLANIRATAASQTRFAASTSRENAQAALGGYGYRRKVQPHTTSIDGLQVKSPDTTRLTAQEKHKIGNNGGEEQAQRPPGSDAAICGGTEEGSIEEHKVQHQAVPQAKAEAESVPDEPEQNALTRLKVEEDPDEPEQNAQTQLKVEEDHDGAHTADAEPSSPVSLQQGTDSSVWASAGRRLLQLG